MKKLIGLETLHVTASTRRAILIIDRQSTVRLLKNKPLFNIKTLPFKKVTVIIADRKRDMYGNNDGDSQRWTLAKKREVAEDLRSKLLDPKGHEVYKVEQKELKARRKVERQEDADARAGISRYGGQDYADMPGPMRETGEQDDGGYDSYDPHDYDGYVPEYNEAGADLDNDRDCD
ncbi:hypothetical protein MMC28_002542 [Mycoblastus sanguinarius]|nr:hypothetical protein [Mycoblastus sanguinarius]